jgi:hypothetical protein
LIHTAKVYISTVDDPPPTDPDRDAKRQGWLNTNIFAAKLSRSGVQGLDQRNRAWIALEQALERSEWNTDPDSSIDRLNADIPAAAAWIDIDGEALYEKSGPIAFEYDWDESDWKGERGWSKERFEFWRKRFEQISVLEDAAVEVRTKVVARKAAQRMKEIEERK